MRLMDKQRKVIDTRRPNYAVFRRRRRIALLVLTLLAALIVAILGLYLLSGTSEETIDEPAEQVEPPAEEEPQEAATEEEPVEEEPAEEEPRGPVVPEDPTLYLTVPKLGLYGHTVRNDDSEVALDLGAVKLPDTDFPWEQKDTNTYIACHRLGCRGILTTTFSPSCREQVFSATQLPAYPVLGTSRWFSGFREQKEGQSY